MTEAEQIMKRCQAGTRNQEEREACATLCDDDMVQARYFFYCLVASILQTKLRPEENQHD